MKNCANCGGQLPDNFIACSNCGAPLPAQPTAGSVPMQLFMYDAQIGKKIGTGNSMDWLLYLLLVIIFSFVIIIPVEIVVSNGNVQVVMATLCIWFAIIAATIIAAFVCAYKWSVGRTAYIYYNGILYKEMLWGGKGVRIGGSPFVLIHNYKHMKDFEQQTRNIGVYLQLFARYSNGEQVWNSVTGGDAKIDMLKNFKITGETKRQYNYTYIDETGNLKSDKLLKCYPNIETVFNFCQ